MICLICNSTHDLMTFDIQNKTVPLCNDCTTDIVIQFEADTIEDLPEKGL
jgi:hypothetical protein